MSRLSVPPYWRERGTYYRLEGVKCRKCGAISFPRKYYCPSCNSRELEGYEVSREGRVINFTVSHQQKEGFDLSIPMSRAEIELNDGVRIYAQLVDVDPYEVREGMEVEATLRRVETDSHEGIIYYGTKFRPKIT